MSIKFPRKVLKPIENFLKKEEKKLKSRKKDLVKEDPFEDFSRIDDNAAVDADAAEQAGHERVSVLKMEIEKALINIRKTLSRIKIGKYGICEKCGKMIDTDRLSINPTAILCIECEKRKAKK